MSDVLDVYDLLRDDEAQLDAVGQLETNSGLTFASYDEASDLMREQLARAHEKFATLLICIARDRSGKPLNARPTKRQRNTAKA